MNNTDKLSDYVTYGEAIRSDNAKRLKIDNTPRPEQLEKMKLVAENVFDKIREHFGTPIGISSFFRSEKLNAKTPGSSNTSDHTVGRAIDMDADIFGGITNKQIFDYVRANLPFKQLIWEYGTDANPDWVHVSYDPANNKKEVLRVRRVKGKPVYEHVK